MHVTHLADHALALAFGSCSAPSRLRMEVPPEGTALPGTSPLAASSAPPFPQRSDETEVLAIGAPGRRSEYRHHSADS
jgi:hypothetical protein